MDLKKHSKSKKLPNHFTSIVKGTWSIRRLIDVETTSCVYWGNGNINPFVPNAPFLYPLKTENLLVDVFSG